MVVVTECENMFWGVTIDTGKRYSQVVKQGFHVSMASLEVHAKKPSENVQIMLHHESSEFLLCTLNTNLLQQALDLNFAPGEQVSFSLNGSGVVHLTGYLIPDEEEPDFDESFSDSEEEEEMPSLVESPGNGQPGGKRKAVLSTQTAKKLKLSDNVADDDEDSDEDDDDYSEEEEDFSDDFDDEFDEDDDDEEEDEDDDDDSSPEKKDKSKTPAKLAAPEKPASQKKKQNLTNQTEKDKSAKKAAKSPHQEGKNNKETGTPKQVIKVETPSSATDESAKKKKKKKKKKNKKEGDTSQTQNDSTASTPGTTPKAEATPKKRVVAGGTVVEDLKVGHGPEAKPGKMASVYYVGTLAKSSKRFDSCTEGKPFRFRLNQGEVIKGWDNGVLGMKVGGKRRITVPANQGYGNVKQGPIPPNSTLVFEVELKAVS